jgi:hypothetical protein
VSRPEKLPLVSPNWWTLKRAVEHVRAQTGYRDIADWDFLTAVNEGRLWTKIEQRNWLKKPPLHKTCLLTPKLRQQHELTAHINNAWILMPRAAGIAPITPPYALFFWGPDLERIWPSQVTIDVLPEKRAEAPAKTKRKVLGKTKRKVLGKTKRKVLGKTKRKVLGKTKRLKQEVAEAIILRLHPANTLDRVSDATLETEIGRGEGSVWEAELKLRSLSEKDLPAPGRSSLRRWRKELVRTARRK